MIYDLMPQFSERSGRTGIHAGGFVRKRADQSITSSITLVDCTDMAVFLDPYEVWFVMATLLINAHGTPDIDIKWTAPTSATFQWQMINTVPAAPNSLATELTIQGIAAIEMQIVVGIVVNDATEGLLQLQFAQNVSDANATIVKANSNITSYLVQDPETSLLI